MKLKPMSPKLAATAILLTTAGATFAATPAYAASEDVPPAVMEAVAKYETSSFESSAFEAPKIVSWAVAYEATSTEKEDQLDPAEKAVLLEDAERAKEQKAVTEKKAAVVRVEQARIAAEKAAIEKAAAEKAAAEKAAADKIAADKIAAEKAAADAAAKAEQERLAAAAAAAATAAQAQAQANAPYAQTTTLNTVGGVATPANATFAAPAADGSVKSKIVQTAYQNLGVPYVWGGTTQAGWDCSGMVGFVYSQAGIGLPRTVNGIVGSGMVSHTGQPQAGDLVVYANGGDAYHIGIYVSPGKMIHAPVPGQVTQVSDIWGSPAYYSLNG